MSTLATHLRDLIAELSAELPEVSERRMFGSDGFWANGTIYALVWDGRVVLRLPDDARCAKARALDGGEPFDPMGAGRAVAKWVVLPEGMADDVEALRPWIEEAHREAMCEPPKQAKKKQPRAVKRARR